ncbi:putative skeletal organic matrix protein 5 isoform X2 [Oculina patagonica]
MVYVLLLSVLIAIGSVAVNGGNTSSVSNKTPVKLDDRTIICNVVQDSHSNEAIKSLEATLVKTLEKKFEQLMAAINKPSHGNTSGQSFASCKDIYDNHKSQGNKAYLLQMDSGKVPVYCHMSGLGACGGGGWTLVMKIDGTKSTFHYDSKLWSNKIDFNLLGGKTGFDSQETKLPTYWSTHFSKICLGMRLGHQIKFIVISKHANSLYSLIADGKYRSTTLGRAAWKTLLGSQASLQSYCGIEGFNVRTPGKSSDRARIGILGNNEKECNSNDSRIGFGGGGRPDDTNACGNEAVAGGDNGDKHIKAMGYIFIQ